jgi:osmotically-inducible protein OsmY
VNRTLPLLALLLPLLIACAGRSPAPESVAEPVRDPRDRDLGTIVDDQRIETVGLVSIRRADPGLTDAHVSVTSYHGVVLLSGQVREPGLKALAGQKLLEVEGVRRVYNELEIGGPTSLLTRSGDAWITSKAKTRLVASREAPGLDIKIVTENGVVYLLGRVRREEADQATEIVRTVGGVRRVVRMFDYLDG